MDVFMDYFEVLAPSIGLFFIFWLVMRSLFRGDSGERDARREAEEREAQAWAEAQVAKQRGDDVDEAVEKL
ncbi:hypothetical protein [Enteractinococcus coprophilus]|uniref:Uncharacterized protein n=1 Tax=Enteractinococcus coprophilus TaxID=1027633 RepID=A0A543APJ2_9MICC|nr:hypothetical protein [Enteractinococcus coprophilus]TQL74501.1 hypothetical protein FB556_0966 [Enteractinococcus coprophilus]